MRRGKQRTYKPHRCLHSDPEHPTDPDYTFSHPCTCLTYREDHPHGATP